MGSCNIIRLYCRNSGRGCFRDNLCSAEHIGGAERIAFFPVLLYQWLGESKRGCVFYELHSRTVSFAGKCFFRLQLSCIRYNWGNRCCGCFRIRTTFQKTRSCQARAIGNQAVRHNPNRVHVRLVLRRKLLKIPLLSPATHSRILASPI